MPAELATTLAPTEADRLLQAEALVRAYCGWHIAPERTEELVLHVEAGNPVLLLPSLHVTAVTVTSNEVPLIADADYAWEPAGVLTSYWWAATPVTVEFTHGYPTPPAEVTAVVQAAAQRAVDNPGSLVRRQAGPFADTYSQSGFNQVIPLNLLDAEKEILDRYKLPPRP